MKRYLRYSCLGKMGGDLYGLFTKITIGTSHDAGFCSISGTNGGAAASSKYWVWKDGYAEFDDFHHGQKGKGI
jgi:hypothetical protein